MRALTVEQKEDAYLSWRTAVVALVEYRSALRDLELELGADVDGDEMARYAEEEDWSTAAFERFLAGRTWPA